MDSESGNGSETTHALITDYQQTLIAVTDEKGNLMQRFRYNPFGGDRVAVRLPEQAEITTRGYTDHEHIVGTDVIHMNGRIYDSAINRFLQADPIVQAPGFVLSYNRYSYVWNNPINGTDPSGYYHSYTGGDPSISYAEGHNSCNPCSSDPIPKDPALGGGDPKAGSSDPSNWFSRAWNAFTDWTDRVNKEYIDGLSPQQLERALRRGSIGERYRGYAAYKNFSDNLETMTTDEFNEKYGDIIEAGNIDIGANMLQVSEMSFDEWKSAVRTDGIWDYKNNDVLKKVFSSKLLDEFGNVHFGMVAKAFGFNLEQSMYGAGVYQVMEQKGGNPTDLAIATSLMINHFVGYTFPDSFARYMTRNGFTWGDNPGDALNIMNGWDYANENY